MKRRLLILSVALLAGCAGPRPEPPRETAIAPPSAWRGATSPGETVSANWWTAFGDPVLSGLVQEALAHNDDVAIAAERVEAARAQYKLARAQQLPDVTGAVEGGRDRDVNPGFGVPEQQNFGGGLVNASWDLDLFGRLRNAARAARAGLLASEDARDAVRLSVAASTAQGYLNLRALDARLELVQRTLAARAEALRVAKRQAETGYGPSLALHQAEAEYHAAAQLIPATRLAISRQETGLALLLGRNPGEIARGTELDRLSIPSAPADLPASLLRRRPDIAEAEQQLVAADRSLDAVRAAFMPDLQLSGQGGGVVSSLIEQNPTGIYTVEGAILSPIFDSGRLKAQQQGAAAQRDQAAYVYRKAALTAFKEVEDALAVVQRSAEQETALAQQRAALAATLELATRRYRSGYSPYLEQVDAERALLSAELDLIQSRTDRLNAAVSLYEALGGGWTVQSASAKASG